METKPAERTFRDRLFSLVVDRTPYVFPLRPVIDGDRVTYHKHWFVLVSSVLVPFLSLVVSCAVVLGVVTGQSTSNSSMVTMAGLTVAILSLFWLFWRYDDWRNDFYVVTSDRIIDVDRLPLGLKTEVREAPLANVQNLSLRIPNFVAALFDYGDVMVDTAGKQGHLVFESVAGPRDVLADVSARVDAFRNDRAAKERGQRDREMLEWFSAYAELGRIVVLRNPHTVGAGSAVEVEWRVSGAPAAVESCLKWDVEERPGRDYRFSSDVQMGGVGNFSAGFTTPPVEKVHFTVFARIDGIDYWSLPHVVRVVSKEPSP